MKKITGNVQDPSVYDYECIKLDVEGKKLYAFRVTRTHPQQATKVEEGIATEAGYRQIRKGGFPSRDAQVYGVPLEEAGWEQIRLYGYEAFLRHENRNLFQLGMMTFLENGGTLADVLVAKTSDHSLYYLDGRVFPQPIHGSYMQGRFDNATYDLDKAVEILSARDDVRFNTEAERAWGENKHIVTIPSYNADCCRTTTLDFYWTPTQEQAQRLQDSSDYEKFKLVFEEDMLGLRAGGAARFKNYYDSRERDERADYEYD